QNLCLQVYSIIARNELSRDELNNQTRPFGFGLNQFDLRGNFRLSYNFKSNMFKKKHIKQTIVSQALI
ncbi:hypothetical protein BpHYR1_034517, partial [Brachionus plicatilis]